MGSLRNGSGFQPSVYSWRLSWGDAPGWYGDAPLARKKGARLWRGRREHAFGAEEGGTPLARKKGTRLWRGRRGHAFGVEEGSTPLARKKGARLWRWLMFQFLRAKGPFSYQPRAAPWVSGNAPDQGPTARPIEAGRGSACCESVPDIAFIVFDAVFGEEGAVFVLESPRLVMLLLVVDVVEQSIQVRWPHGKGTVAALPRRRAIGAWRGEMGRGPSALMPFRVRKTQGVGLGWYGNAPLALGECTGQGPNSIPAWGIAPGIRNAHCSED